jgi:hypothetical protein
MNLYLFFILVGILILIGLYFIPIKIYGIENFDDYQDITDASTFKLSFPNLEELQNKIASIDYFKFFKESDASARNLDFTFESFREKYSNSIIPFQDKDKTNFTTFYNNIVESIPKKYRMILLVKNLKLAKVTGIENSYPHTHSDIVVFDKSYYDNINDDPSLKNNYSYASTLIHEMVHVKQREFSTRFDDLYRKWGFQSVSYQYLNTNISTDIVSRIRLNPDELPHYRFWVWKNKVMPLIIYTSNDITNINQVKHIGIDWNDKTKTDDISTWKDYIDYFGIDKNNYHPIEILAEYQANLYKEILGIESKVKNSSEGFKIYKQYFYI